MKKLALAVLFCLFCSVGVSAQQTVLGTPYACTTNTYNGFSSLTFHAQSANFQIQYDVTPSAKNEEGVVMFGAAPTTNFNSDMIFVRFYSVTGTIQALNGLTYQAVSTIAFSAGVKVHLTISVNETAGTYSAMVGSTTLATNYAFRTGYAKAAIAAATITTLTNPSTSTVCNLTILTYPTTTVSHSVTLKWNAATLPTGAPAVTGYTVLKGTAKAGPFSAIATTTATGLTYVDQVVSAGQTPWYTVKALNSNGASLEATPVGVTIP